MHIIHVKKFQCPTYKSNAKRYISCRLAVIYFWESQLENSTFSTIILSCIKTSGRIVFIRFLEELGITKSPFEINWHLARFMQGRTKWRNCRLASYYVIDTIQDFLCKLGMKPRMQLYKIIIFSLKHVIVRPTKIIKDFCKDSIYVLALHRSLIILVGLTMTYFNEKTMTSYSCIRGLLSNLHKKSWMVSII